MIFYEREVIRELRERVEENTVVIVYCLVFIFLRVDGLLGFINIFVVVIVVMFIL